MNKNTIIATIVLCLVIVGFYFFRPGRTEAPGESQNISADTLAHIKEKADLIVLDSPSPNSVITSPMMISGKARGTWYFEASFPIILVDWDGLIIAEGYATALSDWMTEDFVPFQATLEFEKPALADTTDFGKRGAIILKKDNPSGLPEYDDALEIPLRFAE